eukprot:TRINITY_DN2245_c0_g1_i1.p1 TRINITY_DN2245_c0_g1~~TRINITY_DN2245_c0_g1_i1.p1  ORF type:complete len:734 (+),score=227.50 TRINITY_DN2245_c0_g1_i1:129-2330(+)
MAAIGKNIVPHVPVVEESTAGWAVEAISDEKLRLLNLVCATLIHEPRYYSSVDSSRKAIIDALNQVASSDPEFVLKLAFYVREDMNIRSTANFLLAHAAATPACRPFLRQYFCAATRLPTDVLETVELYVEAQGGDPRTSIPACLRKAVQDKLATFSEFTLAKYNHEASVKKAKAKERKAKAAKSPADGPQPMKRQFGVRRPAKPAATPSTEDDQKPQRKQLTLKRLIRLVHATKPVNAVMCIVGKKYPTTAEEFAKCGLSGEFDPASPLCGKRMKLAVPETWETQLSAMGNNAATWETLLDHRKVPFMATLRNIRNLLMTGVSPKHHARVIARFENEQQVANSRQFPFRFLAAYDVLESVDPQAEYMGKVVQFAQVTGSSYPVAAYMLAKHDWVLDTATNWFFETGKPADAPADDDMVELPKKPAQKARSGRAAAAQQQQDKPWLAKKKTLIPVCPPTPELLQRYRSALDTAIRLSVVHNVKPIKGRTDVFCDVSGSMRYVKSNTVRGGALGKSNIHPYEISMLLGLMVHYAAERGNIEVFGSRGGVHTVPHCVVEIPESQRGMILQNMAKMKEVADTMGGGNEFFYDYFETLIEKRIHVDRIVVLTDVMLDALDDRWKKQWTIPTILAEYRAKVNPDFQFVTIDLYGSGKATVDLTSKDNQALDVLITGYSDKVLQFLADSDGRGQVRAVERMHERLGKSSEAAATQAAGPADEDGSALDSELTAALSELQ